MSWQDRDYNRTPDAGGPSVAGTINRLRWVSISAWLIGINIAVFLADIASRHALGEYGYFSADTAIYQHEVWRFITFQFLHVNFWHIFFNMLSLYYFGPMVEQYLGSRRYLVFYLLCGMAGAGMYLLLWKVGLLIAGSGVPLVGASAGIFGVLIAATKVAPNARVMMLFPPIPMQLRTMAWVFIGIAVVTVLANGGNAGGEAAHLGGAALGFVLTRWPSFLNLPRPGKSRFAHLYDKGVQSEIADEDAQVDRILQKVREQGLGSLSDAEKRTLQRATDRKNL